MGNAPGENLFVFIIDLALFSYWLVWSGGIRISVQEAKIPNNQFTSYSSKIKCLLPSKLASENQMDLTRLPSVVSGPSVVGQTRGQSVFTVEESTVGRVDPSQQLVQSIVVDEDSVLVDEKGQMVVEGSGEQDGQSVMGLKVGHSVVVLVGLSVEGQSVEGSKVGH